MYALQRYNIPNEVKNQRPVAKKYFQLMKIRKRCNNPKWTDSNYPDG